MKKHRSLRLNRLAAACCALGISACGDDGGSGGTPTATVTVTSDTGTFTATDTSTTVTGTVDTSTVDTSTGVGGTTGTVTGTTGEVVTCPIASMTVFSRSDTDDAWDDNDFSDVVLTSGCPTVLDVTWPHEDDWEDGDPSESDFEETHFTLDSYGFDGDLTGKQLNLTIELTDDVWGPEANAGAYLVSLVSVSTYQYEVEDTGTGGVGGTTGTGTTGTETTGTGTTGTGTTGTGTTGTGTTGTTDAGTDGTLETTSIGGTDGEGGSAGEAPILQTGYTETETPRESRLMLRFIGDRATLVFPLPDKTDEVDSYDPATAIKINVRIYNMSYDEMIDDGMGGVGGVGGTGGVGGATGTEGTSSSSSSSSASSSSSSASSSSSSTSSSSSSASSTDGSTMEPIFEYVTSQFTITHLSVTERGQRP